MGPSRCVAILDRLVAARRRHGSPEALLNPRFFRNGVVMLALVVVALAVVFTVVEPDDPDHGRRLFRSSSTTSQAGNVDARSPRKARR